MNFEIYEGLRNSMLRGSSLKEAMQSFYNSGYKKVEIEEAAGELIKQPLPTAITKQPPKPIISSRKKSETKTPSKPVLSPPSQTLPPPTQPAPAQPPAQSATPPTSPATPPTQQAPAQPATQPAQLPVIPQVPLLTQPASAQKVSSYGAPKKKTSTFILVVLILFLVLLLGSLIAIFIFREQIMGWFS